MAKKKTTTTFTATTDAADRERARQARDELIRKPGALTAVERIQLTAANAVLSKNS